MPLSIILPSPLTALSGSKFPRSRNLRQVADVIPRPSEECRLKRQSRWGRIALSDGRFNRSSANSWKTWWYEQNKRSAEMIRLEGSCHCGAVHFGVMSHSSYPYQLCYCSICRKTAGGGGFAINIMGDARTLKLRGKRAIGIYRAKIRDDDGQCRISRGQRNFCTRCASALWMFDPEWPDLMHPFASAVDTPLPVPPSKVHLMLRYKAPWVVPQFGRGDTKYDEYPELSIEEWHKKRALWID